MFNRDKFCASRVYVMKFQRSTIELVPRKGGTLESNQVLLTVSKRLLERSRFIVSDPFPTVKHEFYPLINPPKT